MTWEEYKKKQAEENIYIGMTHYIKTDIECPNCGQPIYKDATTILTSNPPQYYFKCMNCNWGESYR